MRLVTSVNVACGGHAGNARTMDRCVRFAKARKIRLGAHPGLKTEFGRGRVEITPHELELLLLQQVGALEKIAGASGMQLHHLKLHGSLYHATDSNPRLARSYLRSVARWWPSLKVYARAGGLVSRLAPNENIVVWPEAFADRAYQADGSLVARTDPAALVTDPKLVFHRVQLLHKTGLVQTLNGNRVRLRVKTICVHSDTLRALAITKAAKRALYRERLD